ncbi:hypothetical protein A5320_16445 [Rheinheimera sp. SA_1]|uniref:hypothetical protein n=1 Tax=Rheinheimera sp. SA_1 TaxID=1827365 RepID=UPI0007FB9633|nr:hypothetical protein [Rheinheimera sp. SA_1]OBP14276.1 hypothetical protein A5320_16445 [Rheinheimera sp. SA_1]
MDDRYELSGLRGVFAEAIQRNEPTIVFELNNGRGKFLFMMFFDSEDESTKDQLFIFMRNTQRMVKLKLYGNHYKGQFYLYLEDYVKDWFKKELLIENGNPNNKFDFESFFQGLNSSIPQALPLQSKIKKLRESWSEISGKLPKEIVEEEEKTILLGDKALPEGHKPREKTLRKLYLYADGNADDITTLIENLKRLNRTVSWTNDIKKLDKAKKVKDLI